MGYLDATKMGLPPPEAIRPDGHISVLGFGSLLSERSSRYTAPNLQNFRLARVRGWRRVFAHCAPIFFERGIAKFDTREMSSLSVERCEGSSFLATLFEIPEDSYPALEQREAEFKLLPVVPEHLDSTPMDFAAILCTRGDDHSYRQQHCEALGKPEWARESCPCVACLLSRHGVDSIWRDDVLPCRTYLRHCVLAAKGLGEQVYDDFLDNTFLSDRRTTIRSHLATDVTIMAELPPPELRERYCG